MKYINELLILKDWNREIFNHLKDGKVLNLDVSMVILCYKCTVFLWTINTNSLRALDSQCVSKIWYMEILSKYDWSIVFFLQWIVTKLEKQTCLRKDCFVRSKPYQLCVKATQLRLSSFWPQSKKFHSRKKKGRDCT